MTGQTIAAHLDPASLAEFKSVVKTENRSPSQVVGVSLRAFLDYSPSAKRALFAIDGLAEQDDREFAARLVGRAVLRAYEGILAARRTETASLTGNEALDDDDAIEADAVRICAR